MRQKNIFIIMFYAAVFSAGQLSAQHEAGWYTYAKALFANTDKQMYGATVDVLKSYLLNYPEGRNAADIKMMLGDCFARQRDRDRAYAAYLGLVYTEPDYEKISEAKEKAKQMAETESGFSSIRETLFELVDSRPDAATKADAYFLMIESLYDLDFPRLYGAIQETCDFFTALYSTHEKAPRVVQWQGDMYVNGKNGWDALIKYFRLIHLYEYSHLVTETRLKAGDVYTDLLGEHESALHVYRSILEQEADTEIHDKAFWKKAVVLEEKIKNYDEAAKTYRLFATAFPDHENSVEALFRKAEIENERLKMPEEAIASYRSILKEFPEHARAPEALYKIGEVYDGRMKDYESAVSIWETLAEQYPDYEKSAETLYDAGFLAERKLKDFAKAKGLYEMVISKYPDHEISGRARSRLDRVNKQLEE